MEKTIKFKDFMDKSYKNEELSKKEVDTFEETMLILGACAVAICLIPIIPLTPLAVFAF